MLSILEDDDAAGMLVSLARDPCSWHMPEEEGGAPFVVLAAQNGRRKCLRALIDAGADLEAIDRNEATALVRAAKFGQWRSVDMLAKAGARADVRDEAGKTPLFYCCLTGPRASVGALIQNGADASFACGDGETPLMAAIARDSAVCVSDLVDAGADIHAVNAEGRSAMDYAKGKRRPQCSMALGSPPAPGKSPLERDEPWKSAFKL